MYPVPMPPIGAPLVFVRAHRLVEANRITITLTRDTYKNILPPFGIRGLKNPLVIGIMSYIVTSIHYYPIK
jgi:hypothetical protein